MPINYHYEPDSKIVRAKATEVVTTKDLLNYVESVIEDTKIKKGFVEVIDFEFVRDLVITYSESTPFPHLFEKYINKGCKVILVYVPTDLSYGTFRMLETVITMRHEIAENLFVVARSKDELENKLKEILA